MSGPPPISRWVAVTFLVIALLFQMTLLPGMGPSGTRADLLLVVLLCLAMFNGMNAEILVFAVLAGLMVDFATGYFIGLNVLVYLGAMVVADRIVRSLTRATAMVLIPMAVGLDFASELVRASSAIVFGMSTGPPSVVLLVCAVSSLYTGATTALLYFLMSHYISAQETLWGWERGARR
ncbi:MAG: rod shape-determining protein MreD [Clostridia bacterium]